VVSTVFTREHGFTRHLSVLYAWTILATQKFHGVGFSDTSNFTRNNLIESKILKIIMAIHFTV